MNLEQRVEQLEQQNRRQRGFSLVLAVALCGVVSIAATDITKSDKGYFDTVMAKNILVINDTGETVVLIAPDEASNGAIVTYSASGNEMVAIHSDKGDNGIISTYEPDGKSLVRISSDSAYAGSISTYSTTGKQVVIGSNKGGDGRIVLYGSNNKRLAGIGGAPNGGVIGIANKDEKTMAALFVDDEGNGRVSALNVNEDGIIYDSHFDSQ